MSSSAAQCRIRPGRTGRLSLRSPILLYTAGEASVLNVADGDSELIRQHGEPTLIISGSFRAVGLRAELVSNA